MKKEAYNNESILISSMIVNNVTITILQRGAREDRENKQQEMRMLYY